MTKINVITQKHSAFNTFSDLINAAGGYFPSLDVSDDERCELADAYDAAQGGRGDKRRVHRYMIGLIIGCG